MSTLSNIAWAAICFIASICGIAVLCSLFAGVELPDESARAAALSPLWFYAGTWFVKQISVNRRAGK